MKKIIVILSSIVATLSYAGGNSNYVTSSPVPIQTNNNNMYIGIGLSTIATGYKMDIFSKKASQDRTGAFLFVAGYEYNPYLAVELRLSKSFVKENVLKQIIFGIYLKPQYELYNDVKIYGLLGYGKLKVQQHNSSGINFSDKNLHIGAGVSYNVTDKLELFADYISYSRDKKVVNYLGSTRKVSTSAINMGVNYHF